MTQTLTIIVTCTDRKSLPVEHALQVRNLVAGDMARRVQVWSDEVANALPRRPLRTLYQGETWKQVLRLERAARAAGYEPRLLVASAGLGLHGANHNAPAYGATFTAGSPDVVGQSRDEAQNWWSLLNADHSFDLDGPMLWVLSKSYADVIADDLLAQSQTAPLIFGGNNRLESETRIASNRGLRRALGGTATSLNVRMAIQWLDFASSTGLMSTATRDRWQDWSTKVTHADVYDRVPLTDAAIVDFIRALRRSDDGITKTRALRLLRDAGHACEQRRFAALFNNAGVTQ